MENKEFIVKRKVLVQCLKTEYYVVEADNLAEAINMFRITPEESLAYVFDLYHIDNGEETILSSNIIVEDCIEANKHD